MAPMMREDTKAQTPTTVAKLAGRLTWLCTHHRRAKPIYQADVALPGVHKIPCHQSWANMRALSVLSVVWQSKHGRHNISSVAGTRLTLWCMD